MTQKELLYCEDAVGHEQNIIAVIEDTIERIEEESLKTFLEAELEGHKQTQEELIEMLEGKANEWSNING